MSFRNGKFTVEPMPADFANAKTLSAFLAPDGAEWFVFSNQAVVRRKGTTIESYNEKDGLKPDGRVRFAVDGNARVWISSDRLLSRYENGALVPIEVGAGETELRVASSRTAGPWVITNDKLLKLNAGNVWETIAQLPPLLGAHYVVSASEDSSGALWIGTRSQGLYRVTSNSVEHVPTSNDSVTALHEDSDGTIWATTNSGGLNAIVPKICVLYNKADGLIENANAAVCLDSSGGIWSANGDGGVVKFNDLGVTVAAKQLPWPRVAVSSVAANPRGGIWFCASNNIFKLAAELSSPPQQVLSIEPNKSRCLFTDKTGSLWLSVEPTSVGRWSPGGEYIVYNEKQGFIGGEARCFAEDAQDRLWIGTSQGKLLSWNGTKFIATPLPGVGATGDINAILASRGDGPLWLGTAQAGIIYLDKGVARVLDVRCGLLDNDITQILEDDHGFIWCGSGSGIFRLSREEVQKYVAGQSSSLKPLILGPDEGLPALSCSGYFPGAVKSNTGDIWFATRQGVVAINPAAPLLRSGPREVRIEELFCNEQVVQMTSANRIAPDCRKLQVRFSVLCLSAPRRVRTEYRLDGFDFDWIDAGSSNTVTYPKLRPGKYTFRVRAGTGADADNFATDTLELWVLAPWWQKSWFVATVVAFILVSLLAVVRLWANRRLRRKLRDLERDHAVERERARIAQNMHDDLGASLTHISLLTQAAISESTPERLTRIYEATRDITSSLDEIVWAVNPENDTLDAFAEYLASNAQRFIGAAGLRCCLIFPDQFPAQLISSHVRHHLFLCCREALNNVVKHARAKAVTLEIELLGSQLRIAVIDDGQGFVNGTVSDNRRSGGGNGLSNMQRRLRELGGECVIAPAPSGNGTSISFHLKIS
ncbi:MAG: two-component regulator propeller domain-containing protein [Nibricoccus sp.]